LTVHVWGEDLTGVIIIITVASEGDVLGIGVRVGLGGLLDELDVVSSLSGAVFSDSVPSEQWNFKHLI
jgi:hypothetical protein